MVRVSVQGSMAFDRAFIYLFSSSGVGWGQRDRDSTQVHLCPGAHVEARGPS